MKLTNKERLLNIFDTTAESEDIKYAGPFDKIDYYSLMCKSASKDSLYTLENCNVCMFNCVYENSEAVLMMIAIPIILENNKENKNKHIVERVMDVVALLENSFITLDYMSSNEVREEKFVYLIAIKKL